jgi:hypothetical protein
MVSYSPTETVGEPVKGRRTRNEMDKKNFKDKQNFKKQKNFKK